MLYHLPFAHASVTYQFRPAVGQYSRAKLKDMEVTLHIPDDIAKRLSAGGGDVSRRALEAIALIWNDQSTTKSCFLSFSSSSPLEGSVSRGRGGYCDG